MAPSDQDGTAHSRVSELETLHISKHLDVKVGAVGLERTNVIVVDDFLTSCDSLIAYAKKHCDFSKDNVTFYPGIRDFLPRSYVDLVVKTVVPNLYRLYNIPTHYKTSIQPSYFSLITKQEQDLKLVQKLPHFDTHRPYYFALLHYLNPGAHGGTGFFRHRSTGYECITEQTQSSYLTKLEQELAANPDYLPGYMRCSNALFELLTEVIYRPNRLVVYPGNILHSGILNLPGDIDNDPSTGRLTANIFVEIKP